MNKTTCRKKLLLATVALGVVALGAGTAFAITAPTVTTDFGYDLYDIAVNKIIKGGVGYAGGALAIVYAGVNVIQAKWLPAVASALGAGVLVSADTVTTSLGMLV